MTPKKCTKTSESKSNTVNDPQFIPSNIERYMNNFSNRVIAIERGIRDDVNVFGINTLFDEMG
jgi:hypothetical protein